MSKQIMLEDAADPRGSRKRSIAMAMAMATLAVVGTAGMAWSALSMALDSPLELRQGSGSTAAHAPVQRGNEAVGAFAEGTRAQASAIYPSSPPSPIVIEGPTLSTRGDAALAAAAQDGLFAPSGSSGDGETAPALAVTAVTERTSRPAQRPTPAPVVQASTTAVATQQPTTTTTSEKESRLEQLWATGVFR